MPEYPNLTSIPITREEAEKPIAPEEAAALIACMTGHPHGLGAYRLARAKLELIASRVNA